MIPHEGKKRLQINFSRQNFISVYKINIYFLQKFREYVLNSNRMSRLQAKYDNIRVTLGDQTIQAAEGNLTLTRRPNVGRRYIS